MHPAQSRLNSYNIMLASMGQTHLSYLALLHIHYNTPIDFEEVVDIYAPLHPRRLELDYLATNYSIIKLSVYHKVR